MKEEQKDDIGTIAYNCFEYPYDDCAYYMDKNTGKIMYIYHGYHNGDSSTDNKIKEKMLEANRDQYILMPIIDNQPVLHDMREFCLTVEDKKQRLMLERALICDHYEINTFNFFISITKIEDKWVEFQKKQKKERLRALMKREGVPIDVQAEVLNEQDS